MIARLWSARTNETRHQAYLEHFSKSVLPSLRMMKGYSGAIVLTRENTGQIEILVITLWKSLAAIRQFAGDDIDAAVVDEEAAAVLAEFDRRVRHYEIAVSDMPEATQMAPPAR